MQDTARASAEAQLQYNPQLAQQATDIQTQQAPRLAQSQYDITQQFTPLYRALLEQQFPQLPGLSGQVSQQLTTPNNPYQTALQDRALQQFQSPIGLTPDQQAAQDAIRQRAYTDSARGVRESANLGGTLYSGDRQLREDRARNELAQSFATQDIGLQGQQRQDALSQLVQGANMQQSQRQQAMQELISLFQLAGLQVQQPTAAQFGQAPAPSGNALYNALVQNQGNFGVIQPQAGTPGAFPGLANAGIGAAGMLGAASILACHVAEELYGKNDRRTALTRLYVLTHQNLFLRFYRGFSDVFAHWLRQMPWLKRWVQPVWDRMWKQMLFELETT